MGISQRREEFTEEFTEYAEGQGLRPTGSGAQERSIVGSGRWEY
jgi:hypothetical protein